METPGQGKFLLLAGIQSQGEVEKWLDGISGAVHGAVVMFLSIKTSTAGVKNAFSAAIHTNLLTLLTWNKGRQLEKKKKKRSLQSVIDS